MSVVAPQGFVAAGVACGIKESGALDLALVVSSSGPVSAAAVFTSNRAAAAPVQVSRDHLSATGGRAVAVIVNSGNANAATGPGGSQHAEDTTRLVADALGCRPEEVLVCSTGLIGIPLPFELVSGGISSLVMALGPSTAHAELAAEAILTTDTHSKQVVVASESFTVGAMAKGAAMLAPDLVAPSATTPPVAPSATMLAVITTDARVEPEELTSALVEAAERSFNELSVDGCTSTNDTVIVLASGLAGSPRPGELGAALTQACQELARQMADDAEGATRVATIHVVGAVDDGQARLAARKIAQSQLVQCSLHGGDPYWGRVVSEAGSAGVDFDMDRVTVSYGGIAVCRGGQALDHDAEAVAAHMAGRHIDITVDLGLAQGRARMTTTALSHAYVDENMGTS